MHNDLIRRKPAWAEPYLWLVVGLPVSSVLACLVTGLLVFSGSDAVVSEERMPQAQTLAQELRSATDGSLPAVVGRNHSASGGLRHAKP
jgi:hypothetical protein